MRLIRLKSAALAAAALFLLSGCGDDDVVGSAAETPFGDRAAVEAYRSQLNAVIDTVNAVESEVQERAVGSADVATAPNLSAVYAQVRPRLLEGLVELDRLQPPAGLVSLHEDIRRLLILRIDAQALVMEGYASGDGEALYAEAEGKLAAANALVVTLNAQLCAVDIAIGRRTDTCEGLSDAPVVR